MTKKILLSAILFVGFIFAGQAQGAFQQLAIGVEAGTYGTGVSLATSLSPNFKLKAGLNMMSANYKGEISLEPDGYTSANPGSTVPLAGSLIDPKLSFTNGKLIIDYYPRKNGIFSLSAGLYAGDNSISVDGKINDYQNHPGVIFELEDAVFKPNADGTFEAKLKLGNSIKPYFGLGLGRTIANSRVGFKFDLGLIYQGDFSFEEGKNVTISKEGVSSRVNKFSDDSGIPAWILKCWPMVSFSLSYRIF